MEGKFMHALQYDSYGGGAAALKHVEVPIPSPSKGEVLVKLEAISINPIDWKIQKGTDVAGDVVEVGHEVKNFKPGDKVVAILGHTMGGGLAEYCVTKENLTVLRPPQVSATAGLTVAGLTALMSLTQLAELELDQTGCRKNILITTASGGVGHYAVQLAKLGNAHVTATCGARNLDLVKGLGANEVLDYSTPEGAALKSPSGKKYDVVIHCAPAFPWSVFERNLSETGKVVDNTPGVGAIWTSLMKKLTFSKKKLVSMYLVPKGGDLENLVWMLKEGKLKTVMDSKYRFSEGKDAWAKSMDGHATGKIIVEP